MTTGQKDDCATDCLLDYPYFKEHHNMTAIDLSKQQALYVDRKAKQQINFLENLDQDRNFIYYWRSKRNYGTMRAL